MTMLTFESLTKNNRHLIERKPRLIKLSPLEKEKKNHCYYHYDIFYDSEVKSKTTSFTLPH